MSLSPTLLGLLDACKRQPQDTPRRILADWLDDNGDPARAEFIRLQCDRAAVESWQYRDTGHEHELATTHRLDWLGPLVGAGWVGRFRQPRPAGGAEPPR